MFLFVIFPLVLLNAALLVAFKQNITERMFQQSNGTDFLLFFVYPKISQTEQWK